MNGVHDMGGMAGFGPVAPERDEPVFHAPWEGRVLALNLAAGAWGRWTIDASRHQRERIAGAQYLAMSYYERWLTGLDAQLVAVALVSAEELAGGAGGERRGAAGPGAERGPGRRRTHPRPGAGRAG